MVVRYLETCKLYFVVISRNNNPMHGNVGLLVSNAKNDKTSEQQIEPYTNNKTHNRKLLN